ncbi:MAG: hypothetical protein ACK5K7_02295, partial [Bacilli bacterium]
LGWYYYDSNNMPTRFEFDKPLESDMDLVALWNDGEESNLIEYKVIHKSIDGTILVVEEFNGSIGSTITTESLAIDDTRRVNYPYVDSVYKDITLEAYADNEITYYYNTSSINTFTVYYLEEGTNKVLAEKTIVITDNMLEVVYPKEISGYKVDEEIGEVNTEAKEYTFYYRKTNLPDTGMNNYMFLGILTVIVGASISTINKRKYK